MKNFQWAIIKLVLVLGLSVAMYGAGFDISISGVTYKIPYKYQTDKSDSTMTYSDFYVKNSNGQFIDLTKGKIDTLTLAKLYASSNIMTEIASYGYKNAYDIVHEQSSRAQKKIEITGNINTISSFASNISSYIISNVDVAVASVTCATAIAGTTLTFGAAAALGAPACIYAVATIPGTIGGIADTAVAITNDYKTISKTKDYSSDLYQIAKDAMTKSYNYLEDVEKYYYDNNSFDYDTLTKKYMSLLNGKQLAQLSININNEITYALQVNGNIYLDTFNQVMLSYGTKFNVFMPTGSSTAYSIFMAAKNDQLGALDKVKQDIVDSLNTTERIQYTHAYFSNTKINEYKIYFDSLIKHPPKASFTLTESSAKVGDTIMAISTSTDEDGNSLTHTWLLTKPTGSNAVLTYNTAKTVLTFIPDKEGEYNLLLNVSDGKSFSNVSHKIIVSNDTTQHTQYKPTAVAVYPDYSTHHAVGETIRFKIRAIDPDNGLSYVIWSADGPAKILESSNRDDFDDLHSDSKTTRFKITGDNGGEDNPFYIYADVYDKDGNNARVKWVIKARETYNPVLSKISDTGDNFEIPLGKHEFKVNVYDKDDNLNDLEWYLDGTKVGTSSTGGGNPASQESIKLEFFKRANHTLKAVAVDKDGNKGEVVWNFVSGTSSDGAIPTTIDKFEFRPITGFNPISYKDIIYEIPKKFRVGRGYEVECEASNPDEVISKLEILVNNIPFEVEENNTPRKTESRHTIVNFDKEGSNTLSCKITESSGNVINKSFNVNVLPKDDTSGTAPELYNIFPSSDTIYTQDTISLSGQIKDNEFDHERIYIYVDDELWNRSWCNDGIGYLCVQDDSNFDLFLKNLPTSGTHTLKLVPIDQSGNKGKPIIKTLVISSNGNHTPKIRKVIPSNNETIYAVKNKNTRSIIVFAEDQDGDLDKIVWDFTNVVPVNSKGEHKDSYNIEENSVSNFFDRSNGEFRPSRSGTIYAKVCDKNNHCSSNLSFNIQVVDSVGAHSPQIINLNIDTAKNYQHIGTNDISIGFDTFDSDGDLKSVMLLTNNPFFQGEKTDDNWTIISKHLEYGSGEYYFESSFLSDNSDFENFGIMGILARGEKGRFMIRAEDKSGHKIEKTFTITKGRINKLNHAPDVETSKILNVNQRESVDFSVNVIDEEGDLAVPTVKDISNKGIVEYLGKNRFKYIPDEDFYGEETFNIEWNDGYGGISHTSVTADVKRVIRPPVIQQTIIDIYIDKGEKYNLGSLLSLLVKSDAYKNNELIFSESNSSNTTIEGNKLDNLFCSLNSNSISGFIQGTINDPDGRKSLSININILLKATIPQTPSNIKASDGTYSDKVVIENYSVDKATSYEIYRSTSSDSTGAKIATTLNASYDDTATSSDTNYYYRVKACNSAGCSDFSDYDSGYAKSSKLVGDVNGDGVVNILDVVLILKQILGEIPKNTSTGDVNGDKMVNILDAVTVLKKAINK